MPETFNRKIYTLPLLLKDLGFMLIHAPQIGKTMRTLDHAFVEKIMTVVTAVNGCVYCAWFHAKQAVASGISPEEVQNMLNLQFQADAAEDEVPALLYAQHYTETDRHPDPEMVEKLTATYGEEKAQQIQLVIRMITFGNLSGNTFDAFLSRLKGVKAPNSNAIFEFFFFLFSAPMLLPLRPVINKK
jgi:AhpD family alkylhydroperoxidase